MNSTDRNIIALLIGILFFMAFFMNFKVYKIENQLQNYHIINSECEAILTYKQFAQPQLLCYMGDEYNYSNNERRVINQWKTQMNK